MNQKIFFITALIILLLLIWWNYWRIQLMFNSSSMSFFTPSSFKIMNEDRYNSVTSKGFEVASQKKIVICGLVRDISSRFNMIRKKVERLGAIFKDYHVLIVENDSKDDSRQKLLDWHASNPRVDILGCGYNVNSCKMKFPKTEGHGVDRPRIQKMAHLRSIYLDEIKSNFDKKEWDYVAVWDLDIIGSVYIDGIANSIGHFDEDKEIDAMCANGFYQWGPLTLYYDTYAHLDPEDSFHIDLKTVHDIKKGVGVRYSRGHEPVDVTSCFSGFTLYRRDILDEAEYDMSNDGNLECEHVRLHKNFKKMKLNPSMIHLVIYNE